MIFEAQKEHAEDICFVIKQSIKLLCHADHQNNIEVLSPWLCNKTTENCEAWTESKQSKSFVAIVKGKPIGISQIGKDGHIYLCYISPNEKGKGFGTKLLAACEKQALDWAVNEIIVDSTLTAKPFYESHGFKESGKPVIYDNLCSYPLSKVVKTISNPGRKV